MDDRSSIVAREDLLTFVNACFASSGQREFYSDGAGQRVSLAFLHAYVAGNYRTLYARCLALDPSHESRARIVTTLLATGRETSDAARAEENALVTRALAELPVHRAMHLLEAIARAGINNRRTRAIVRAYLASRGDAFRAVKYRRSYRRAARSAHVALDAETRAFFGRGWKERRFATPIFEAFRRAHYAAKDVYALPATVAAGLAAKHGIDRGAFLARIAPRMTPTERLRAATAATRDDAAIALDGATLDPTKVASYVLSLPLEVRAARAEELGALLGSAARAAARRAPARYGRVAVVVDRSASSAGSREKARRPLAVAIAVVALLRATSDSVEVFVSGGGALAPGAEMFLVPGGATDLATPVLAALAVRPDLLVVVSDGYENAPAGVAGPVLEAGSRLDRRLLVVHLNPVFDADALAPRALGARIPTVGIREAEDLPTALALARLVHEEGEDGASLGALERLLEARVRHFLAGDHDEEDR